MEEAKFRFALFAIVRVFVAVIFPATRLDPVALLKKRFVKYPVTVFRRVVKKLVVVALVIVAFVMVAFVIVVFVALIFSDARFVIVALVKLEFLLDAYIDLKCARPMPTYSVPGMIDHF